MELPVLSMERWNGWAADKHLDECVCVWAYSHVLALKCLSEQILNQTSQLLSLSVSVFLDLMFIHLPNQAFWLSYYMPHPGRQHSAHAAATSWKSVDELIKVIMNIMNWREHPRQWLLEQDGPGLLCFFLRDETWSATATVSQADRSCHVRFLS